MMRNSSSPYSSETANMIGFLISDNGSLGTHMKQQFLYYTSKDKVLPKITLWVYTQCLQSPSLGCPFAFVWFFSAVLKYIN